MWKKQNDMFKKSFGNVLVMFLKMFYKTCLRELGLHEPHNCLLLFLL